MACGAELILIGSLTRAVNKEWDLDAWERGLIVSVVFIGVWAGNLMSGNLGDKLGRRFPILLSYAAIVVFSVMSTFAWDFYSLASVRLLVGISFGLGQPACNTLCGEVCPADRRLHMNGYSQMFFAVGEVYSASLILMQDPRMRNLSWRWLIAMGSIPSAVLFVLAAFFLYETPSFLAVHGRNEEAKKVLEKMSRQNGLPESESLDFRPPRSSVASESGVLHKLGIVFGPSMLFTTIVTSFSCFALNFLFYGGIYSFPKILPDIETGVSPAASLLIAAATEIPGFIFGILVGVNVTRKTGTQLYLLCTFLSTLLFIYAASEALARPGRVPPAIEWMLQAGLCGNKVFTSVGFLVVYCYALEIYATVARTTGNAFCLAMGRLGSISCPVIFELLTASTGTPLTFLKVMAAVCILNAVMVSFLSIETAGKLLKDNDDETMPLKP